MCYIYEKQVILRGAVATKSESQQHQPISALAKSAKSAEIAKSEKSTESIKSAEAAKKS